MATELGVVAPRTTEDLAVLADDIRDVMCEVDDLRVTIIERLNSARTKECGFNDVEAEVEDLRNVGHELRDISKNVEDLTIEIVPPDHTSASRALITEVVELLADCWAHSPHDAWLIRDQLEAYSMLDTEGKWRNR